MEDELARGAIGFDLVEEHGFRSSSKSYGPGQCLNVLDPARRVASLNKRCGRSNLLEEL